MTPEVRAKYLEKLNATTRGYRTGAVETGRSTQVRVKFENMHGAASWAQTFKMSAHVVLDEPTVLLDQPVTLVFSLLTYADQMQKFLSRSTEKEV